MNANVGTMNLHRNPAQHAGWMTWTGRVLSALPVLGLAASSVVKLIQSPQTVQMFTEKFGYPQSALVALGGVELACAALYAFPRTSVLGAILITAYLGGAVATHVRVSDAFVAPIILGVFVWGGLFLRDERVRALVPLRHRESA